MLNLSHCGPSACFASNSSASELSMESNRMRRAPGCPSVAGSAFIESMALRTAASAGEAARALGAVIIMRVAQTVAAAAIKFTIL